MVAIGNGHAHWAQAFIEDEGIEFPVYVDPSRQVYKEFGMQRGRRKVLNSKSKEHSDRAQAAGFKQSAVKGDPWQNGGVIVFDENGDVLYSHVDSVAGDHADLDEVIAALD